jgi:hypothetical protein
MALIPKDAQKALDSVPEMQANLAAIREAMRELVVQAKRTADATTEIADIEAARARDDGLMGTKRRSHKT